jgi:hypothetical protein
VTDLPDLIYERGPEVTGRFRAKAREAIARVGDELLDRPLTHDEVSDIEILYTKMWLDAMEVSP